MLTVNVLLTTLHTLIALVQGICAVSPIGTDLVNSPNALLLRSQMSTTLISASTRVFCPITDTGEIQIR
jgi:hypothetical protein